MNKHYVDQWLRAHNGGHDGMGFSDYRWVVNVDRNQTYQYERQGMTIATAYGLREGMLVALQDKVAVLQKDRDFGIAYRKMHCTPEPAPVSSLLSRAVRILFSYLS